MFSNDEAPDGYPLDEYRARTKVDPSLATRPDAEVQVSGVIAPEVINGAWVTHIELGRAIDEQLKKLPGAERTVEVEPFEPRVKNGWSEWG